MLRLKELRIKTGISQLALAREMAVSRSTVAMWERGTEPSNEMLQKLADFFNVTVDYLLGREVDTSASLGAQLSGIDFALSGEIRDLSDDEKRDILDYVRFKRSQKKGG